MIPELHRSWIAATIARQERCGQCADPTNLSGTVANTVVFRITADAMQELAAAPSAQSDDSRKEPND